MPEVIIGGFDNLDKDLQELARVTQRAILIKGVRNGAIPIVAAVKSAAPKASGALAESISTQLMTRDNSIDQVTIRIGPTKKGFYGSFHDRGTKEITATHWFMNAFRGAMETAKSEMIRVLREQILKATKK